MNRKRKAKAGFDLTVDVSVSSPLWETAEFDAEALAQSVLPLTLEQAADLPPALRDRSAAEISVVLSSDEEVQALNRDYRGKDKPTNVLSFAALDDMDGEGEGFLPPPDEPLPLGDVIIAYETAAREATEMEVPLRDHVIHLMVHGTLHLLGYDHEKDDEAEVMESLEIQILNELGLKNPYSRPKFMA